MRDAIVEPQLLLFVVREFHLDNSKYRIFINTWSFTHQAVQYLAEG